MKRVDPYTLGAFLIVCAALVFMVTKKYEGSQIALVGVFGALATAIGQRLVRSSDDPSQPR